MEHLDNSLQQRIYEKLARLKRKKFWLYILGIFFIPGALGALASCDKAAFLFCSIIALPALYFAYQAGEQYRQLDKVFQNLLSGRRLSSGGEERLEALLNPGKASKKRFMVVGWLFVLCLIALIVHDYEKERAQVGEAVQTVPSASHSEPDETESQQSVTSLPEPSNGWQPSQACNYLKSKLPASSYKDTGGGEYWCGSSYFNIGSSKYGLPNNIAFYGIGTQSSIHTLKLVVNYNVPNDDSAGVATAMLITQATELSQKATGSKPPESILQNLLLGEPAEIQSGQYTHQVLRDDWPTGKGYEVHYILKR